MLPLLRTPPQTSSRSRTQRNCQDAKRTQRTDDSGVELTLATRSAEPFDRDTPSSTGFHGHGGHGEAVGSPGGFVPVNSNTSGLRPPNGAALFSLQDCKETRTMGGHIVTSASETFSISICSAGPSAANTSVLDERDRRGRPLRTPGVAEIYRMTLSMSAAGEPIAEVASVRSGGPAVDVKRKHISEDGRGTRGKDEG
jgi:hypothetical protein